MHDGKSVHFSQSGISNIWNVINLDLNRLTINRIERSLGSSSPLGYDPFHNSYIKVLTRWGNDFKFYQKEKKKEIKFRRYIRDSGYHRKLIKNSCRVLSNNETKYRQLLERTMGCRKIAARTDNGISKVIASLTFIE